MAINNEIGTIQPIEEISTLSRKVGALLHCDAARAGTAMEIGVERPSIGGGMVDRTGSSRACNFLQVTWPICIHSACGR